MKKIGVVIFLSAFFCLNTYLGYSQVSPVINSPEIKTIDVNKDGKSDVTYYKDGERIGKIEADTNYDGKPDITVYNKDGKFESAEVDANYDGKSETTFTDVDSFNKWLNENHPDLKDKMNSRDWQFDLVEF